MAIYFTVLVPWTDANRTEFHPTEAAGPFSVLSRGCFPTVEAAQEWATERLNGTAYTIKRVDQFVDSLEIGDRVEFEHSTGLREGIFRGWHVAGSLALVEMYYPQGRVVRVAYGNLGEPTGPSCEPCRGCDNLNLLASAHTCIKAVR